MVEPGGPKLPDDSETDEFEDDFGLKKPELPAKMRLFKEVVKIQQHYFQKLKETLGQQPRKLDEKSVYFKEKVKPLKIGNMVKKAYLGVITVPSNRQNLIQVQIEAWDEVSEYEESFMLLLEAELPPTIIRSKSLDDRIDEIYDEKGDDHMPGWGELLSGIKEKYQLNDTECEDFLKFLEDQEPDPAIALYEDE